MDYKNLIVERDGGVGTISLNRPEVLNALNGDLLRELDIAVGQFEEDSEISVIVFTGKGDQAFSAGADVDEVAQAADDSNSRSPDSARARQVWRIATCAKPTIGAINGLAYGSGAVMASSFDIRVGCQNTSFRFLAATYGRVNSTWSLPLQVGWPMAKELLFTARLVEAREAHGIGLLNHLVAADQLLLKAIELAKQIAANDPGVVQGIKELMLNDVGADWEQMYHDELDVQAGKLRRMPATESIKEFFRRIGRDE